MMAALKLQQNLKAKQRGTGIHESREVSKTYLMMLLFHSEKEFQALCEMSICDENPFTKFTQVMVYGE